MSQQQVAPRIQPVSPDHAQPPVKELYGALKAKMGKVLNIFQNMGNSAPVLEAFLAMNTALSHTSLSPTLQSQIALMTAQYNRCNYCLAAHTAQAHMQKLSDNDMMQARHAKANDPKTNAILAFAEQILTSRGNVSDKDIEEVKAAGVTDQQITEIVLAVITNIFTNYFNLVTATPLDMPEAPVLA